MQITFKGTVIGDNTVTTNQLIGWSFQPSVFAESVIDIKAPIGCGYFSKSDGYESITHSLELQMKVTTVSDFAALLKSVATLSRGDLVIPTYGTYPNCRLSSISPFQLSQTDDSKTIVQTTLTFTQYPTGV